MNRKKLITFVCVLGTIDALAQGTVHLSNFVRYLSSPPIVNAPFFNNEGVRLQGSNYVAQLYYWSTGFAFEPAGAALPFATITNGYFFGGTVALPGVPGGAPAWVQVRAWQAEGAESFEQAALAGAWTGLSEILYLPFTGNPSSGGVPMEPVDLMGLQYPGKPLFVRHLQAHSVPVGATMTFSVVASSGVQMSYQWYQQRSDRPDGLIVGETNATYTTPALVTNITFWVNVTNSAGSVLSDKAIVTVVPTPPRLTMEQVANPPVLKLDGFPGINYRIECSTNLNMANWTTLLELSLSTSPFTFSDSGRSNSAARFYR